MRQQQSPRRCEDQRPREGTHMQDVSAAGQVAPVSQGRAAQVHAAFRPAPSWRLAITGETEAELLFPHRFPRGKGELLPLFFLAVPASVGLGRKPVTSNPCCSPWPILTQPWEGADCGGRSR